MGDVGEAIVDPADAAPKMPQFSKLWLIPIVLIIIAVMWFIYSASSEGATIRFVGVGDGPGGYGGPYGLPDTVRGSVTPSSKTRIQRSPVAGGIIQAAIRPSTTHMFRVSSTAPWQSCDLCPNCTLCPDCPRCVVN